MYTLRAYRFSSFTKKGESGTEISFDIAASNLQKAREFFICFVCDDIAGATRGGKRVLDMDNEEIASKFTAVSDKSIKAETREPHTIGFARYDNSYRHLDTTELEAAAEAIAVSYEIKIDHTVRGY